MQCSKGNVRMSVRDSKSKSWAVEFKPEISQCLPKGLFSGFIELREDLLGAVNQTAPTTVLDM
jgi:hypothetical protein